MKSNLMRNQKMTELKVVCNPEKVEFDEDTMEFLGFYFYELIKKKRSEELKKTENSMDSLEDSNCAQSF